MTRTGIPATASLQIIANRRAGVPARLQPARQGRVPYRDRNADAQQTLRRHWGQQIKVAFDQRSFGGDRQRVMKAGQHPNEVAHYPVFHLDRLIGVGVGADRNRGDPVGPAAQLGVQHSPEAGPRNQPGFKIELRRQVKKRMTGAGKAINAAMFAAALRVDGPVERQVGRAVACDGRPRPFQPHFGAQQRQFVFARPTAIDSDPLVRLAPTGIVGKRHARLYALHGDTKNFFAKHIVNAERSVNKYQLISRRQP
jgi:hypothetical protein